MEIVLVSIIDENSVLMQTRPLSKPNPGMWEIPGGKLEDKETPEDAAKRELFEELDIVLDFTNLQFLSKQILNGTLITHIYVYNFKKEHLRNKEGQSQVEWVSIENMRDKYPSLEGIHVIHTLLMEYFQQKDQEIVKSPIEDECSRESPQSCRLPCTQDPASRFALAFL